MVEIVFHLRSLVAHTVAADFCSVHMKRTCAHAFSKLALNFMTKPNYSRATVSEHLHILLDPTLRVGRPMIQVHGKWAPLGPTRYQTDCKQNTDYKLKDMKTDLRNG